MTAATNDFVDRLVYLTGIPTDASEQEVTDMVGAFGKINNVILMPCSEEESEKAQGQKVQLHFINVQWLEGLRPLLIVTSFLGVCMYG